jgi:hypothetical protein
MKIHPSNIFLIQLEKIIIMKHSFIVYVKKTHAHVKLMNVENKNTTEFVVSPPVLTNIGRAFMSEGIKNMEGKRMHAIKKVFILERRVESVCFMLYSLSPLTYTYNYL